MPCFEIRFPYHADRGRVVARIEASTPLEAYRAYLAALNYNGKLDAIPPRVDVVAVDATE